MRSRSPRTPTPCRRFSISMHAGPGRSGRDDARRRRPVDLQEDRQGGRSVDHHAERDGRGGRPGHRAGTGGRRLPAQALQSAGASGSGARGVAQARGTPRSTRDARLDLRIPRLAAQPHAGTNCGRQTARWSISPPASSSSCGPWSEHPRRVLSRFQLLEYARGPDSEAFDRAMDVQISRLRKKLQDGHVGSAPGEDLIRTVRNEGYIFDARVTRVA